MSSNETNASWPPKEPRLSPEMYSLGRWSAGSFSHASYTLSKTATPVACALDLSTRNEIQLGRYEYCVAAIAVSPPSMYSSESTAAGSTHPVPVVVTTTSALRSKPPARRSSLTSRSARACTSGADCRPAYTRTGTLAGSPVNSAIWAWVGPRATKLRPCRPRLSHAMSESGLPDRSGAVGRTAPASVVVSLTLNAALDTAMKARKITPLSNPTTSSATAVTAIVRASHRGSRPTVRRSTQPVSRRRTRPSATRPTKTSSATTARSTES